MQVIPSDDKCYSNCYLFDVEMPYIWIFYRSSLNSVYVLAFSLLCGNNID